MTLRHFLAALEGEGDLRRITVPVATDLELAALTRREFASPGGGRALYFQQPHPRKFPAVSNLFGSAGRMSRILGGPSLADFGERLASYLDHGGGSAAERIAGQADPAPFELVATPYCENGCLGDLPALRAWPGEVEPYLTMALTITCHPETGHRNIGLYRAQVKGDRSVALNFSPLSGAAAHLTAAAALNKPLPVCLILGADPIVVWAAAAPLPSGCDELEFCHRFFQERIRLAEARTQPLQIPDSCEIVIEGELRPGEVVAEGPFGNHTGQYVSRADCPLVQVTAVRHRPGAVMPVTVVGPPPSENIWLAAANEILIRRMLNIDHPEILRMCMPKMTVFHGVTILTVSGATPGQVKQLVYQLWQTGPLKNAKLMIIVDDDIDPAAMEQCWWRTVNRLNELRVYQSAGRTAIDATGVDPLGLVVEDKATQHLLSTRQQEPGYPLF